MLALSVFLHKLKPQILADPKTRRFQAKREAIVDAATLLFNRRGVKATTLADIASSVGLVTNSVTYYYRKKEDLATVCFLRAIDAFNVMVSVAPQESTVQARMHRLLQQYTGLLAHIEDSKHPPMIVFSDLRALPTPLLAQVFAAYTDMFRKLRAMLKLPEALDRPKDEANACAHIVLSVVNALRGWISRYEPDDYMRVGTRVADILLHGMCADGSRWASTHPGHDWQLEKATTSASGPFLRVATELVNEQGYQGASVDKISAWLNVTKGSFYHHNDNKQDLIFACFERTFAVLRRGLSLAERGADSKGRADNTASGWERACTVACALVRFQLSTQGPLLRITATSALPDQTRRDQVRRTMQGLTERMVNIIVDGMMDGSIRPLDPGVAAHIAVAVVNAAAELPRWSQGAREANVGDLYVRALFVGLLQP